MGNASSQKSEIQNKRAGNPAWVPGVSGNPGGRPKDMAAALFREILEADNGKELRKLTEGLLAFAKAGDARAAQLILERAYCKPAMASEDRDAIAASGKGVDPLLQLYGVAH